VDLKDKKILTTQINVKVNDISSADENKQKKDVSVQPLFKNYIQTVHLFIHRRR
jgi:hypothetical protein